MPGFLLRRDRRDPAQLSSAAALATATAVKPASTNDRISEVMGPTGTIPLKSAVPIDVAAISAVRHVMAIDSRPPELRT
jgi:hypothetical protein